MFINALLVSGRPIGYNILMPDDASTGPDPVPGSAMGKVSWGFCINSNRNGAWGISVGLDPGDPRNDLTCPRIPHPYIVAMAWAYLLADRDLIRKAFLNCGIFIHPDGREDHLINVKGVNNTTIDPNGWFGYSQVGNAFDTCATVPDDDDLMTALVSAAEGVSIKLVAQKQHQEEGIRRGIPKSGTKSELLVRLQAHQGAGEEDEFATITIRIELGTPISSSSPPSGPEYEN